ncbi:MAG: CPBP family intramembrane glutamic endopeptidase [Bacteroides sp.]
MKRNWWLSLNGRGKDLLYGLLVATTLYGVGFTLSLLLGAVTIVGFHFYPMQLLNDFFYCFLVALLEEIIVRGFVLGGLLRLRMNRFLALVLSSVLFGAMHLFNPDMALLPMLNIVLAGMMLGVSFLYTRNLWFPISLHLFWNWIQGPILGYGVSGNQFTSSLLDLRLSAHTWLSGGSFGFEGSIVCTVLLSILVGCMICWFERRAQTNR